MYSGSLRLAVKLYPIILFAAAAELVLQVLKEQDLIGSGGGFPSFFIWSVVACYAHFAILLPEDRDRKADNKIMMGFILRNLGLSALFIVPSVVIIFLAYDAISAGGAGNDDQMFFTVVILATIPVILIFLLVFSLLGTLLPAYVAGRAPGIKKAFQRGRRSFFPVMGKFIIGPGPIYFIPLVAVVTALYMLQIPEAFFDENWVPNIPVLVSYLLLYCIHGWAVVMAAWILSHTFLEAEADEGAGESVEVSGEG